MKWYKDGVSHCIIFRPSMTPMILQFQSTGAAWRLVPPELCIGFGAAGGSNNRDGDVTEVMAIVYEGSHPK